MHRCYRNEGNEEFRKWEIEFIVGAVGEDVRTTPKTEAECTRVRWFRNYVRLGVFQNPRYPRRIWRPDLKYKQMLMFQIIIIPLLLHISHRVPLACKWNRTIPRGHRKSRWRTRGYHLGECVSARVRTKHQVVFVVPRHEYCARVCTPCNDLCCSVQKHLAYNCGL